MAAHPENPAAHEVVRHLRQAGHSAWLAGGCVRDLLLGQTPKDFDVATSARPEEILRLFPDSNLVGAHFGVVIVRHADEQVEAATFRSDLEYIDGRRPSGVRFETDPREDVLRRDFTINALLLDPESGEILDYVGGRADLEARIIRAIGDPERRFREDHLRLLRAIRFAARLNFEIEPATFEAIRKLSPLIQTVSAERVRDELTRILTEGGARRGFILLDATGLLAEVLPEISAMKGVGQPPEFHPEGDVWVHTLALLAGLDHPSAALAWGALLHDVGKPDTFSMSDRIRFNGHVEKGVEIARALMNRLRFSNQMMTEVEVLIANHMKFKDVPRMKESTLKRFIRLPQFEDHMALHRLDCLASNGNLASYDFVRRKQRELPPEQLKPTPLLTGIDLIAAGYKPGPVFSKVLSEIEDAQLEGRIHTREEALTLVAESASSASVAHVVNDVVDANADRH